MKKTITKIAVSVLPLALAVVLVLPTLAQTTGTQNQETSKSTASKVDSACVQGAIEKRDTALIAAVDTYAVAAKSALQVRKDAEKSAWNQTYRTKAYRDAMKAALVAYRNSVRAARKDFQNSRKSIWTQFKTDRKACGSSAGSEEFGGQGQDESL